MLLKRVLDEHPFLVLRRQSLLFFIENYASYLKSNKPKSIVSIEQVNCLVITLPLKCLALTLLLIVPLSFHYLQPYL